MQFHREQIALIGIQEARTTEGCRVSDNYKIYSSGFRQCGNSKHFGCELWQTLPFCTMPDGRKIGQHNCKITIAVQDPKIMVVYFEGPLSLQVVVAHAPCVSAERPMDVVKQWWEQTAEHVGNSRSDNVIVLIDANAPLADHETQFFGLHHAEPMNPQGIAFQDFIVSTGLYAPSTFSQHSGMSATWRHPRGDKLRRDYVLLSRSFFMICKESYVKADFDGGFCHVDHCPALCATEGFMLLRETGKRFHWDFHKIHDVEAQNAFSEALKSLPLPSCSMAIDDHSKIVETNIPINILARKRRRNQDQSSVNVLLMAFA